MKSERFMNTARQTEDVHGNFSFTLNHSLGLYIGLQYMNVGNYSHVEGDKQAGIDFGTSLLVSIGLKYAF